MLRALRRLSAPLALASALSLASADAWALALADIQKMLAEKAPEADIVKAIRESYDKWYPRDVYALVDQGAPTAVIAAVASKAAVFYDGTNLLSLDAYGAKLRAEAPAETVTIRSPEDMVILFERFSDFKAEREEALKGVPPLAARGASEMEASYDKRVREHAEAKVAAAAMADGKLEHTTFDIELPMKLEPFDSALNCYPKASFEVDLNAVSFFGWRDGMGGSLLIHPVKLDKASSQVALLEFNANGTRRFRGESLKICPYDDAGKAAVSRGVKIKMKIHRTAKGQDWTGTAEIVDGAGQRVPTKK